MAINETGISWPGDKGGKFKQAQNSADTQWINPEDEHFIVWMRTSGLPNFKKLWGRIEQDLPAGSYKVLIQNNYNSVNWAGNRYLYLTTKSIVGGKNFLLPTAFLVVGVVCIIAAILFWRRFRCFKVVSDSSRLLQQ